MASTERLVRFGLATFAVIAAAPVAGQPPGARALEEIVVRDRWDNPLGYSITASQGVVGAEELDLRPRLRTGEILEAVPGLIVTQHSGTGKSNQMFLRGFNLDHGTDFATYVDGMPVNMPTHGHGQGYTDLNFIIPELVERLEYRKGGYYADAGDFSAAGSASLETADTLDAGLLKLGLGEKGYARALVADSVAAGEGDFLYGLQTHRYDGAWTEVDEALDRHNALLKYSRTRDGSAWEIGLMAYEASWNSADQIPRRAVESGLTDTLGSIDTDVGGSTSRFSLSGSWAADVGAGRASLDAYAIDYELGLYSNFTYRLDDPVNGDEFEQLDKRRIAGGRFSYAFGAPRRFRHTFGATLRMDDIDDVGLFRTAARRRLATVRRDSVEQLSFGLYYSNEKQWSERLRSIVGLRADYYDFDVASDLAVNSGSADDSLVTPRANLIYALDERTELYVSAAKGFHSNDARGTTISVDPVSGEPAEPVDALVDADEFEFGFRTFVDRRLNLSAALWYLELDSELLFVGDAGNTEASRPSRRYGLEVPLYYRPNERWTLDFELALTESEFTDDVPGGDRIPGAIERVVSMGVTGQFGTDWFATLRARYFGPRPLVESGGVESGSSTVVHASTGFERGRFALRVDVLNLLDSDDDDITYYYASRLPGEPAAGIEDEHFHPIEPRMLRMHFAWRF